MAVTATLVKRTKTIQGLVGIFTLTASGNYASGGNSLDFAPKIGYTNRQPKTVVVTGLAGYIYEYDLANKKLKVRQGAVAGTIAATFAGTAHSHSLFLNDADVAYSTTAAVMAAANKLGANTGGDIVVAGVATTGGSGGVLNETAAGLVTAALTGTAAPGSELPASAYPAGVTGDTITAIAIWV